MCSHPCTNTNRKILLIDTNALIYTKQAVLENKENQIYVFWKEMCKKYCCLCEERQFTEEFWTKENNQQIRQFFDILKQKGILLLKPYPIIVNLDKEWKTVIDELKKLKNNDEKGLARLVKLCKHLIDSGCNKNIFEFLTYDRKGAKILYRKLRLQISNNCSHKLWHITQLPPNWPQIFSEIIDG
jgi:hypothetical protein